jgi:hypothetical protein
MSSTNQTTPPAQTLRDGALFAKIWRNSSEKGTFYSVQLGRTYSDDQGNLHDSGSFSNSELLRIARLAQIAYDEVLNHREEDKQIAAEANGS